MYNFKPFATGLAKAFAAMSTSELHRVNLDGDQLWAEYLAAFPEGTNPIFRTRTEHDGSYDRNFVRRVGNVVRINDDGSLTSIWDIADLDYPYAEVAAKLSALVRAAVVVSVFRIEEKTLGYVETTEKLEDGNVIIWNHFNAEIAKRHQASSVAEVVGALTTTVQVFRRGLESITTAATDTMLDLIDSDNLYRGAEFRKSIAEFSEQQALFSKLKTEQEQQVFLWKNVELPSARFRNTAIGTLATDLSEGKDLEAAVASFEKKVAGDSYKRPTAVITKGMVDQAMKTIQELDLEPSLERRHAKLTDVHVDDVLWVNNGAQAKMKGGIESLLSAEVTRKPSTDKAEDISIEDFMSTILPKARTIEALVKNVLQKNLMSVTAPVHDNVTPMFKWGNDFAWSYNGNIADSLMRAAVQARGGSVTGVFRFTHQWNYGKRNASLMDLHVFMPGHGEHREGCHDDYGNDSRVGWNNRRHRATGGVQDVDYVTAAPAGYVPVENITFPDLDRMPDGEYTCKVHNWNLRAPTEGGFRAEIEFAGQIFEYEVDRALKHKEWVTVAVVTKRDGHFTIRHVLPCGSATQDAYGIQTETFVPVSTVMLSPNFWGDKEVGNKHWFFILEGCRTEEPVRGIYNEFLRGDLDKHRKVFEILGNKTKCEPADEQLSGLGFSSTQRETLTVRVVGEKINKSYNIKF